MNGLVHDITSLIPQRPPFLMIDELTWHDEKMTRSNFFIQKDNIFVNNNRFSEPGLVENIAQTAAARAGYISTLENKPVQIGYIGAAKNLVIHSLPAVGDKLETEIKLENQVFDVTLISGQIICNGSVVAACEMKIFISPSK